MSVLALLLGGLYLIWRGTINWRIPAGILGGLTLFNLIAFNSPFCQLLGGALFLGAFFMATDWVTSPMTNRGKWIYAAGIGVTVAIDRLLARPRFGESRWHVFNRLPMKLKAAPLKKKKPGLNWA